MTELDWRPDDDCGGDFRAPSQNYHDGRELDYVVSYRSGVGGTFWLASFDGTELYRGSLPKCLDACAQSEAADPA